MLDRRLWPNAIYVVIILVVCVTIWQITRDSDHFSPVYTLYTSNSSYTYPINTLAIDDYHQLIDLNNFTFTIFNLPCNESNLLLLILVHSDPKNFDIRRTVRQTWGSNTNNIKVVFMIGLVSNSTLKSEIEKENEDFGDLVQGSFEDTYKNLTYKHVMVFKYVIYHCSQARYILKTDDDVFVNTPLMMNFLTSDLSPFGGSKMLFCTVRKQSQVLRSWRSKWRVSFKEYPAKTYPPYCPGWAILYSPDVVFELYKEAQKSEYFWIDDVHITGTLVAKIHLAHVNVEKLVLTKKSMGALLQSVSDTTFLFGAPNIKSKEIEALWQYVKSHDMRVSLLKDIT